MYDYWLMMFYFNAVLQASDYAYICFVVMPWYKCLTEKLAQDAAARLGLPPDA